MKILPILQKLLSKSNNKRFFSSGLKVSGIILIFVVIVVTLFLFTGKVFVELFGALVFPFPKRANKKNS
jgi:sugar phosphate permease